MSSSVMPRRAKSRDSFRYTGAVAHPEFPAAIPEASAIEENTIYLLTFCDYYAIFPQTREGFAELCIFNKNIISSVCRHY